MKHLIAFIIAIFWILMLILISDLLVWTAIFLINVATLLGITYLVIHFLRYCYHSSHKDQVNPIFNF